MGLKQPFIDAARISYMMLFKASVLCALESLLLQQIVSYSCVFSVNSFVVVSPAHVKAKGHLQYP